MPPTQPDVQDEQAEGVAPKVETPREPETEATGVDTPEREGWDPEEPVEADQLAAERDAELKEAARAAAAAERVYVDEPGESSTTTPVAGGTSAADRQPPPPATAPSSERAAVVPDGGGS